jgi:hypothetical protein
VPSFSSYGWENQEMDGFARPTNDMLPDLQESQRRLVLFLGEAKETLARAKEFARTTEKQVRKLLRVEKASPLQKPHFSRPPVEGMDEYQSSL